MVSYPIYTVDAFTTEPFKGNPAAIVLLPYNNDVTDVVRQKLAAEMNISETAYITPIDEKETFEHGSKFNLRWFTPIMEVPLCGHATLASATVLFKCVGNSSEALYFETLSGTLVVKQGTDGKFIMDFPYGEPKPQDAAEFEEFVKISVGDLPYGDIAFSDSGKLVIRLGDNVTRQQLESLDPSPKLLIEAKNENVKGVIVTLKGNGAQNGCVGPKGVPYDFLSRCFAPRLGIDEDPVTGSAHTVLGPYWSNQLGKKELFACQCSKRSGELWLNVREDRRVEIGGFGYVNKPGQFDNLIKVAIGDLPYIDVARSDTGKLLVRFDDSMTREEFDKIAVPGKVILEAHKGEEFMEGVLITLKGNGAKNGCLSPNGEPYDFLSRYFASWVGVDEDPVCGSAHTVSGPYWAQKLNKKELFACQSSKRSGEVWVAVKEDRVELAGYGTVVVQGTVSL